MTTSIRSMPVIAIFVAAAIVPVASAGASPKEPVQAGNYGAAPVDASSSTSSLTALGHPAAAAPDVRSSDTSSYTSSLTALSHDYGAAPDEKSSVTSSLTALSHDSSAPPADTSSGISSVTALSHDSDPTVTLHRDGSQAEPFVANLGPEPTAAPGDGFDWGDAGIGAGAVLLVACLAMVAAVGFSGRRRSSQPTAASQSA
jgi:hypothetical protein